jgi:ectoine hydroxylase-related dioxygenase (phytanoyl-CoA dioxygenase family)
MYKSNITKDGYCIIKNVFSKEDVEQFTNVVMNYVKDNKTIKNGGGITIPDFIKMPQLKTVADIRNNKTINNVLHEIFNGNNYRFCSHNDIGINRMVGWHKDKLNGNYAKYETVDIWSKVNDETHEIVKVLLYLEDHSNNNDALKVIPGSHLSRKIDPTNVNQLKPSIGDVIIFDQRISHRGMDKQVPHTRILLSFGFGKNNIFTDNFEKGTIKRQHEQNKSLP